MELSGYEACMPSRTNHGIYNNFIIGAHYTVELDLQKIAKAVKVLCLKYPHFSLTVGENYTSEYLKEYDILNCIEIIDDLSIDEILDKYTDFKFSYINKTPLWKVLLDSKSNTLFFVVDHSYFDGTAGKNFHSEFSKALDITIDDGTIIKPSFKKYPKATDLMGFQERESSGGVSSKATYPQMDVKLMELPMYRHNHTIKHLNLENTNKLINLSRSKGFKLTGLIYYIASKSITKSFENEIENAKFCAMIPINSRFKVPRNEENDIITKFGLFFGKYFTTDDLNYIKENDFITISSNFQKALNDNIDKCMEQYEVFETNINKDRSLIDKSFQQMRDRNDTPLTTVAISNLGMLSDNKIGLVYFDQSMVDAAFGLHLISSNEGLSLNFTSHRAVPKDVYQNYVNNGIEIINELLKLE